VCRRVDLRAVDHDLGRELLLLPAAGVQELIDRLRDIGLAAAANRNLAALEPELRQHRDDVIPLRRKVLMQDRARVLPLVDFVVLVDEGGEEVGGHGVRLAELELQLTGPCTVRENQLLSSFALFREIRFLEFSKTVLQKQPVRRSADAETSA